VDLLGLTSRAAQGDRRAGNELVRATYGDVWRFACSLVGSQRAPDAVQDTYLRAWRSLQARPPSEDVRAWLLAIAWRASLDALRRDYRWRQRKQQLADQRPASISLDADHAEINSLLAHLDPDRRAAFVLTQLLGYSYAETALICATEIGTIRSRVARARADLVDAVSHRPQHRTSGQTQ
jgi:RNA polymerase sigma-70 factor (ECF subfamily)